MKKYEWAYRRVRGWYWQNQTVILEGIVAGIGAFIFFLLLHIVKA